MLHPYTKCLTRVLQVSPYFWMKIWDLVKSSELAWSIEDLSRHNALIIDYLFKHKQNQQKDWICLNRSNYKTITWTKFKGFHKKELGLQERTKKDFQSTPIF
jgi:hypothetical protein